MRVLSVRLIKLLIAAVIIFTRFLADFVIEYFNLINIKRFERMIF